MTQKRASSPKTSVNTRVKRHIADSGSDSDSCPNSPSSVLSEDEMHDTNMSCEWTTEWYTHEGVASPSNWVLGSPKFKFCKKRKEYFTDRFESIWYKAPYKYNALLNFTHGPAFDKSPFVQATLSIIFEDGTPIDVNTDDGLPSISRTESIFRAKATGASANREIKLGPFQFNVCSYKYDGKRFRLQLSYFLVQNENGGDIKEVDLQEGSNVGASFLPMCTMISPPFLIKAKKPIAKPGIKSKKRSRDVLERAEKAEVSLSPVNGCQAGMEINHIPIPASYANMTHFDISSLSSLPLSAQKQLIESQLALLNRILPIEPALKKTKHTLPSFVQTTPGYTMPGMCSAAEPMFFGAYAHMHQEDVGSEEPFRSMEHLTEEEHYTSFMSHFESISPQPEVLFDLDAYTGPQLAAVDCFSNGDNLFF